MATGIRRLPFRNACGVCDVPADQNAFGVFISYRDTGADENRFTEAMRSSGGGTRVAQAGVESTFVFPGLDDQPYINLLAVLPTTGR